MRRILVVDDFDTELHRLKRNLVQNGYEVYTARSGEEALNIAAEHRLDLLLLDLGLPDISGLSVCKELRVMYPALPIIIISARKQESDKVEALNSCADDYVSKPYFMSEVLARIKVQFLHVDRMRAGEAKRSFTEGPLTMDFAQRCVLIDGQEVDLTYTEYELLYKLVTNRGMVLTYNQLLNELWGDNETFERSHIHVYVNRLRKKIETPTGRRFIFNEAKVGYRFKAEE